MAVYGEFCDSYVPVMDGVVVMVRNYATLMHAHGHRPIVVGPKIPGYTETDPFEVIRLASAPLVVKPPYRFPLPALSVAARRQLQQTPFDLIHAQSPMTTGWEAMRVARRQEVPLVATFHTKFRDDFMNIFHNDWVADRLNDVVMRYFDKADAVWTVNKSTEQTMREYGYKGRVDIVPIGTDLAGHARDAAASTAYIQQQHGITPDEMLLLFVGQIAPVKNPMLVVSACAALNRAGTPCRLVLVGQGMYTERIREQAQREGIADRVTLAGCVYDRDILAHYYTRANLFVFPSIYDNAPLVVREASAMGCPSLLLTGTNAAEGVTDGVNGFLADSNELAPFAQKLREVLADPACMRQAGLRARDTLAFSWESIVRDVEDRYAEIIREYARRPSKKRKV